MSCSHFWQYSKEKKKFTHRVGCVFVLYSMFATTSTVRNDVLLSGVPFNVLNACQVISDRLSSGLIVDLSIAVKKCESRFYYDVLRLCQYLIVLATV